MILANNEQELIESLFNTSNGKTFDGFLRKVKNNSIDFWARGKEYTITRRGLIVARNQVTGKTFYQHQIDGLFPSRYIEHDFAEAMLVKHGIEVKI